MISTIFDKNPSNFTEFTHFLDFMVLGPQNQGSLQTEHVFKAQIVTHFVISLHFRGCLGFYSKKHILTEFQLLGWISWLSDKNYTFPVLGLQNTSQMITFIKGITLGATKTHLGAKSALFRHRGTQNHGIHYFSWIWHANPPQWRLLVKSINKP